MPDRCDILASVDLGNVSTVLIELVNDLVEEKKTVQKVCAKFAYKHNCLQTSAGSLHDALVEQTFMPAHQVVCWKSWSKI